MSTPQEQFWNWFLRNETELFEFDPVNEIVREQLFDRVAAELQKVNRDLTFEFSPKATPREFVVSAAGLKRAFPAVISLVQSAPELDRWKIIAFRPRRTAICSLEIGDQYINPKDVLFTLLDNGKSAGISLFIPGFQESDANWKQIGYLLLDQALGEYDVETRLGLIKMLAPETRTEGNRYPLPELPVLFDQLAARLEGRSEMPS